MTLDLAMTRVSAKQLGSHTGHTQLMASDGQPRQPEGQASLTG